MSGAEPEIRKLLAIYCQLLDDGFIEPSQQADARGKHMINERWIEISSDATATATTDLAWVSKQGAVGRNGRYHGKIVKQNERWQFERRDIVFTGDQPE